MSTEPYDQDRRLGAGGIPLFVPAWDIADAMNKSLKGMEHLTVQGIAQRLGVSRNTVGNWLNGRVQPDDRTLIAWAELTAVPYRWLIGVKNRSDPFRPRFTPDEIREFEAEAAEHGVSLSVFLRERIQKPIPEDELESYDTVLEHYSTIRFKPEFIEAVRASMDAALQDAADTQRLLRSQLQQQIKTLGVKEENLIDLAADGQIAKAKIHAKLREIERARLTLQAQLDDVNDDLSAGADFINECLKLLARPEELYAQASNETRRKLNQAIFKRIFVMNDEVVGHEMVAPLGELLAAQTGFEATQAGHDHETALRQAHAAIREHDPKIARAARNNQTSWQTVDDLLTAMDGGDGSSKPSMVRVKRL